MVSLGLCNWICALGPPGPSLALCQPSSLRVGHVQALTWPGVCRPSYCLPIPQPGAASEVGKSARLDCFHAGSVAQRDPKIQGFSYIRQLFQVKG